MDEQAVFLAESRYFVHFMYEQKVAVAQEEEWFVY